MSAIVVGPQGQAVLIEQKNGALEETPDGLVKHYTGKTEGVARQIHRSLASLQFRFQQGRVGQHLALDYLLCGPDCCAGNRVTAGTRSQFPNPRVPAREKIPCPVP
jgi:hypothetical protein